MNTLNVDFWLLVASIVLTLIVGLYLFKREKSSQLRNIVISDCILSIIISLGVLCQSIFRIYFDVDPMIFENFIYIGTCFLPVTILFTVLIFTNTKINFRSIHILLFVIPTMSLLTIWTNNYHHLFYEVYSSNLSQIKYGSYIYVHSIYTYVLYFTSLFNLLKYSIRNSSFFSKQAILMFVGSIIPIIVNLLGTFGIINVTVYITPISFAFTIMCYALAIFKFKLLKVTPIALQKIVDRISDSYMVINEDNKITDFNQTFLTTFSGRQVDVRNKNLFTLIEKHKELNIDSTLLEEALEKAKGIKETVIIEKYFEKIDKYFHIEINRIETKGNFLGILILLKDVTQHNIDMQTIKNNQDMLIERERLASLGQMIGGIAHNLKTPIMSIAGAAEGLTDLIKEYDSSIGDKDVTEQDHHDIAKDMQVWVEKVKDYTAYMSDVITAVKGQAVTLSEEQSVDFTIEELVKRVNILMKHELKNALVTLNVDVNIDEKTVLKGNINSLVQVVNNMISNAIQSYQGKPDEKIDMSIYKKDNDIVIKISDYGCGLPKKVQDKLFKEMITTKGKNGTGLGLFMSYSNIRAHFSGNINFETEEGNGTTFYIYLPLE